MKVKFDLGVVAPGFVSLRITDGLEETTLLMAPDDCRLVAAAGPEAIGLDGAAGDRFTDRLNGAAALAERVRLGFAGRQASA